MARIHNFYAGPAALPLEVLKKAQEELLDWKGTGMSVMEISHRSKEYDALHNDTINMFKKLLKLGDDWTVLFLQGGASTQFLMLPMNFLSPEKKADYIITGAWSQKALKEAKRYGKTNIASDTNVDGVFSRVPKESELKLSPDAEYVHLTSNNTIFGTQMRTFPNTGNVPIVADMSSDALSYEFDTKNFGVIYAGAQKNLGPAGVTIVAMRKDMQDRAMAREDLPTMLAYRTHLKENSLYNTCPCFPIYIVNLVLHWIEDKGGLKAIGEMNTKKAELLYGAIENSGGFYRCPVDKDSRSFMNVVFRLQSEALEEKFISEGKKAGYVGLKGHRSVGGIRVSTYNANGFDSVKDMVGFMQDFQKKNG